MKGLKKKKGFTLVELMAAMAIFIIFIGMIGSVFVQGYKILNRTNNYSAIEDEFRNAIMSIEKSISEAGVGEVEVKNETNGNEKILIDIGDGDIQYVEVKNNDGSNSLVEKSSDSGKSRVLVNKIERSSDEFVIDINENNGILTLDVSEISKGNSIRKNSYFSSIILKEDNSIELNIKGDNVGTEQPDEVIPPKEPEDGGVADITEFLGNTFTVLDMKYKMDEKQDLISFKNSNNENLSNEKANFENVTFYMQQLSNNVLNSNIPSNQEYFNGYNPSNNTAVKRFAAPKVNNRIPKENCIITSSSELNSIMGEKGSGTDYILFNGKLSTGSDNAVGVLLMHGNDKIMLINGDLEINLKDNINLEPKNSAKYLAIYATGSISIKIDNNDSNNRLTMSNCSLISGENIELVANNINVVGTTINDVSEKLKEDIEEFLVFNEDSSDLYPDIEEWNSSTIYKGGEIVKYNGVIYVAAYYNTGCNPEYGNQWRIISEEPTEWKSTKTYLGNQIVKYKNNIYRAKWENTGEEPDISQCWELSS